MYTLYMYVYVASINLHILEIKGLGLNLNIKLPFGLYWIITEKRVYTSNKMVNLLIKILPQYIIVLLQYQ